MSLAPATRLGAYEIAALIGAGGMGEVYRARDTRLNRDVAIKVLPEAFVHDAERLARFKREAQMLASLNHPHIAAIYGLEESANGSALVLELVEGATLADRIARGPIPIDEALAIARQIADALEAAHEHGIVHRDLKPANIKLTADDKVKVLDFGLAKALDTPTVGRDFSRADASMSPTITSPAMTMGGVILGTAAYMSPEQSKGRAADKRSDVWAFGCVLYEMLTARRAFEGDDTSDTLAAILRAEPDWNALPADTPGPIRVLLRRCLEKDRGKRVSDAGVARFVLSEAPALQSAPGSANATPLSPSRLVPFIALAAVCVVLASLAAWFMLSRPVDVRQPIRYAIVPPDPEPLLIQETDRNIAMSPDGTFLIYRVAVAGQPAHLAMRRVDQLEATVLKGTAGARTPFVSPDGRWVGFWSEGELKKISVSGGPAITLCRSAYVIRGSSWGDDDTIVFASTDPQSGLMRVPGGGGEPQVLTKGEPGGGDHLFPSWLPGSDRLLFSVVKPGAPSQIFAIDLKTSQRTLLIQGGSQPMYVDSGHLVYASAGALHAVRFDPSTAAVLSAPVPIVEQVLTATNGSSNYDISRTGTLAYMPGETAVPRRALTWVDRQGGREELKGPLRGFSDPRLSPDAQRIAVEIVEDGDDIWTFDVARGALEKKTFELAEDETPVWSPDGRWIAYSSTRGDERVVIRRRADGSGPEERLWIAQASTTHVHVEQWMSDGRSLLIATAVANGAPGDIGLLPIDGDRTPKPLLRTPFNERGARVSPDGRWLVYTSNESGRDEVYVRPFPSLDGKWQVSTAGGSQPVWSRKGDELFYRSDAMMSVRITPGTSFIPTTPQRMFDDRGYTKGAGHTGYDISPDARRFLMISISGSFLSDQAAATINVVVNWFDELNRRTSAK